MKDVLFLLLGATVALVAAWYLYVAKMREKMKMEELRRMDMAKKYSGLVGLIDSVHSLAFGPYGANPQALVDAFNKLWKANGLPEKGVPKGGS